MAARKKKAANKGASKRTKARTPAPERIERTFKGKRHTVTVTDEGFRYAGKDYRSLTAIAKQITGYPAVSGPRFFGTTQPKAQPKTKATKKGGAE